MIEPDVVRHVATLARLGLDPSREEALVADLVGILRHFEAVQAVDVSGVEPLVGPLQQPGTPAADSVQPSPCPPADLLALTLHAREGFYVVPPILDGSE